MSSQNLLFKNLKNAKYQVYGLGNALVDIEFEVENQYLNKMKIEKGIMTLVDESRQSELIQSVHGFHHRRSCGGSAANTVIAVAYLGGSAFYSCKIASDETGDFYLRDLEAAGVKTNWKDHARPSGTTGKCMVFITPDADRTMNTYLGITATFAEEQLDFAAMEQAQSIYIEGYLVASPTGRAAAIKARQFAEKKSIPVALTFSDSSMPLYFRDGLLEMIGQGVDMLFCNEAEAKIFTQTDNLEEAFIKLKKYAKFFAITQGDKGALLFDGSKEIVIVAPQVEAIDTNGAGDLFAGSFLYAITAGRSFAEAGQLACAAASRLVTQFGARLTKDQLLAVKQIVID